MPHVTFTTTFGSIQFDYESEEQLQKILVELPSHVGLVEAAALNLKPKPSRAAKPGFEDVYGFLPDGSVELYQHPAKGVQLVCLVLYAYSPSTLTIEDISRMTGIPEVNHKVLSQKANKKYLLKEGERFSLTPEGVKMVQKLKFRAPVQDQE